MADVQTRTRDLLANERTFLAWVRTGATVMVLGLAIAKFGDGGNRALAAGTLLVAVGVLGVLEGTRRRARVARAIETDQAMPVGGEAVAAFVLIAAVIAALILLLV